MRSIQALEVPTGLAIHTVFDALQGCLAGEGPLLLPHAPGDRPAIEHDLATTSWDGGLAVATSGSTGSPKRALLSPAALTASANATHDVLGGPGRWLLALPGHHIAGLQVILRSLAAGHAPAVIRAGTFTPAAFLDACDAAGSPRPRYTSLVPTQLSRLLTDADATTALARFDAVLVGGSAVPAALLRDARAARVRVVTTYGMSETAGGCVYDDHPLPGVRIRLLSGRIQLGGATLADGYLDPSRDFDAFDSGDQGRWFHTGDRGRIDPAGELVVEGRSDDVIITGGLKVWPTEVENALAAVLPPGQEAVVVAVPDPTWGAQVGVAISAPAAQHHDVEAGFERLIDRLRGHLPAHALPRRLRVVETFPLRGPGKPDRAALGALFRVSADVRTWENDH